MSTPVTIEDIYKLFQASRELDEARAVEYDRRSAEAKAEYDRRSAEAKAEYDRRSAEYDRRSAEYDRRSAEAKAEYDRRSAEAKAEYDRRSAEAKAEYDRRSADIDRRLAKLDKSVEQAVKSVDALTTRWGRFVEGLVEPAVIELFQQRGIDVKEIHPRAHTRRQGYAMEIDIMAVDDTELVLVECKSRLSQDDVDEFMQKLGRFKQSFPHYHSYRVYGAVAGIEVNQGIDRYASNKGLFVIQPSGDSVAIINDDAFQPRCW